MVRPQVPQEPVDLPPYTVLVQPFNLLRDAFDELHYQKKGFVWDIRSPVLVRMVPYYTFLSAKFLPPSQEILALGNHEQRRVLPKHLANIDQLQLMYYQYHLDR